MFIVWGSRLYGKTDNVPNLFHVATKFGHLYYFPLFPMGSHLVFEVVGDGWRGVPLPFSWKSCMLAWARAATTIGAFSLVLVTLVVGFDLGFKAADIPFYLLTVALMALWYVVMFSGLCCRASYDRAKALAEEAGLAGPIPVLIDLHFGMITESQADNQLAKFEQAGDADQGFGEFESFET